MMQNWDYQTLLYICVKIMLALLIVALHFDVVEEKFEIEKCARKQQLMLCDYDKVDGGIFI